MDNRECVLNGARVSVLQDEGSSGDGWVRAAPYKYT